MDFELSEEEVAFAEGVRALCSGRFPLEKIRAPEGEPDVVDRQAWKELADAGVFSLLLPEAEGGLGLGLAYAAVVFEELGRALVPGPLVSNALAARMVPGAADGSVIVGSTRCLAGDDLAGDDRPVLVDHFGSLDALVVLGSGKDRSGSTPGAVPFEILDTTELQGVPVGHSLDPLTPIWRVGNLPCDGASTTDEGSERKAVTVIATEDVASSWERDAEILTGAMCVGIAAATLDLAVSYAKEREQFGKAIGSFQAVKHLCADMLVRAESARAAVQAAAVNVDQPDIGDARRAAAGAALVATAAATNNSKTCIQVYGGMGFTWELPLHLYLTRSRVLAESLISSESLAYEVANRY
ncbi:MAG TPA: acyl-CoA dehydrogenase family protein [Acidimicrobiales bacterium]|nr:acyl-CoA dehydrogenase family protein [Acidimicrobiales bacterium]